MEFNYKKLIRGFKKLIDERSLDSMTKQMYTFFHLYCCFIAHYNINGFKQEYEGKRFILFLNNFTNPPSYILSNLDSEKQECIRSMIAYAKRHEEQILIEVKNQLENERIKKLRKLANELGYDVVEQASGKPIEPLVIGSDGQFTLF